MGCDFYVRRYGYEDGLRMEGGSTSKASEQ